MAAIPESVMARLHEANEQFHRARLYLDEVERMDRNQRREVAAKLRAAEKELEDVTREIDTLLNARDRPN